MKTLFEKFKDLCKMFFTMKGLSYLDSPLIVCLKRTF